MNDRDKIRELLTKAFQYVKQAHERCYDNLDTGVQANLTVALSLAASCTSCYAAAAAIYLTASELEEDNTAEILRQFERVTGEVRIVYGQTSRNLTGLHIEIDYLERMLSENGYAV